MRFIATFLPSLYLLSALTATPANAIIGGTDAKGDEDFVASTVGVVGFLGGKPTTGCSASLLSDHLVVTAAHCIKDADRRFVGFGLDKSEIKTHPENLRPVLAVRVRPNWQPESKEFDKNTGDIAVLLFAGGVPNGYKGGDVLSDTSLLKKGTHVLLAGYGASENDGSREQEKGGGKLRSVEVTINNDRFSETEVTVRRYKGRGPCHGDSGGPAFLRQNGELYLWGVTSGGYADCLHPSKYTLIPSYAKWIADAESDMQKEVANRKNAANSSSN